MFNTNYAKIANWQNSRIQELQDILQEINTGNISTKNYYKAFSLYKNLQQKKEYKKEIEYFLNLTIQSAKNDIAKREFIVDAYTILADIYHYKKNRKQTLFYINKAINLEPDNAELYFERANFYKEIRDNVNAQKDYKKAIKLNPNLQEEINMITECDEHIKCANFILWIVYSFIVFSILLISFDIFKLIKYIIFKA